MNYSQNNDEKLWFPYKVAPWLGISIQSVHNWTEKYSDLLSNNAYSDGEGRQYNMDDCIVLWTVKAMRDEKLSHGEIRVRLIDEKQRVFPTTTPDDPAPTVGQQRSLTEIDQLRAQLVQREQELSQSIAENASLKEEIAALRGEIKALERVIDKLTSK